MRLLRLLLVLSSTVWVSACSLFSIVYNNLDYYLMLELKSVVSLSGKQEKKAQALIDNLLQWHRKQRLPEYIKWIDEYKKRLKKGIDKEDMNWAIALIENEFTILWMKLITQATPLTKEITPLQIEELAHFFARSNDYYEDYLTINRNLYYAQKEEKILARLESWLGRLTDKQRAIIKQSVEKTTDGRRAYLNYRLKKQRQWIMLLTVRFDKKKDYDLPDPQFAEKMKTLAKRSAHQEEASDYLSINSHNVKRIREAVLSVMKQLTPKQKNTLIKELDFYRHELFELTEGDS